MNDDVGFGHAVGRPDIPLLRRRLYQHEARAGSRLAHDIVKASDRMGPVRVLIAVARIADRLIDLHPLPVGIQLVGDD